MRSSLIGAAGPRKGPWHGGRARNVRAGTLFIEDLLRFLLLRHLYRPPQTKALKPQRNEGGRVRTAPEGLRAPTTAALGTQGAAWEMPTL
ncbi:hypothetical protein NDU88_002036 [Pleurodeles waltl]|uniref:Uncharacterized protein n=1 Tax=Pleurodeles waltl TaxID=8319 RepID=A0AAV7QBJ2_PLEWA|nr:hypothetical protein NDU88_002036 [Pleurodeles waltl]